jgi:hypothetical protein
MFRPPFVVIFKEVFCEGCIIQSVKKMYRHKMFKIYTKISHFDKISTLGIEAIICAHIILSILQIIFIDIWYFNIDIHSAT